jgi:hypothetical protein
MELNSFQEIKINKKQKVTQQRKKYKLWESKNIRNHKIVTIRNIS